MAAGPPEPSNDTVTRAAIRRRRLGWPLVFGLALIAGAIFFALGDVKKFLAVAEDVQPLWLLVAIGATVGAYFCFTGALWTASHIGGHRSGFRELIPTSFVSQAVNNLLSSGGIGGLAIRIYGLGQVGIPPGAAAAISALTTICNDAVSAAGLVVGVVHLVKQGDLTDRAEAGIVALAVVLVSLLVAVFAAARNRRIRERVIDFVGLYAERISRKLGTRGEKVAVAGSFRTDLLGVFEKALARPRHMLKPAAWMAADLAFRILCLGAAFAAIGHPQPLPVLATGFVIGVSAGALSLVPGGIGVIEGSMAAVFSFLGVELEVAAVAVIVFRLAFYVVPLGLVAILFRPLLRRNALPAGQ